MAGAGVVNAMTLDRHSTIGYLSPVAFEKRSNWLN